MKHTITGPVQSIKHPSITSHRDKNAKLTVHGTDQHTTLGHIGLGANKPEAAKGGK